uniref:Uncharacterized protein n=1 Tax=Callorhinchus milii TaxID=7868 RepID=A0A4W3I8V3_CALMI
MTAVALRATIRVASKQRLVPSRAAILLIPSAVNRLKNLLNDKPGSKDYSKEKGKFAEEVNQDGVRSVWSKETCPRFRSAWN